MVVLSLLPIRDDGNSISSLSLSLSLSFAINVIQFMLTTVGLQF